MKKRLTSVLLTIVMVASLFSGMAVTAHADGDTIEYTLQKGDNVYSVCKKLGIDFYANYDWITSTNKITNYSGLAVGRKIILPASGTVGSTTPSTPSTTPSGTTNVKLLTGDSVVSYLVPHVVSYGDTLYDICLAKGIDYNKNIDLILKLNSLKSANRIAVGRTLLLPSASAPASGSCVAVVGHKVVSGDATYNICQSYGISYNDNVDLMKALNGKENMASIKTGQTLLVPVPTTVVPGSAGSNTGNTGNNNTGNTNNGNTNNGNTNNGNTNNGSNNNTGNTTTTSYTITKNTTNVDRGSYSVLVNNTNSSTAAAGDTVTVNATAKTGYKLDYVKATAANGSAITMNGTTFTMPSSNVTIDVYFVSSKDYRITQNYPKNGSYTTVVNGSTTDDAAPGQTVNVVVAPEDGYQLESIVVANSNKKAETVTVTNNSFVMPNFDVSVTVTFAKANPSGNAITTEIASGNGKAAKFKINGTEVTGAKAGEVVFIETSPSDGYIVNKIEVLPNTAANAGDTITVSSNNSFVMPHYAVHVKVYYLADEFNIVSASTTNGSFIVYKAGDNTQAPVSKATANTELVVKPTAEKGYAVKTVKYTDKDGNVKEIAANGSGAYVFPMPTRDTTITVEFRKGNYALYEANNNATFQKGGKTVTYANPGDEVTVVPNAIDGYRVSKITAKQGDNDVTVNNNKFTMPIGKVVVTVSYEKLELAINKASTSNGSFSIKLNDNNGSAITKAKIGDIVYVATSPNSGYHTSKITMTDAKGNVYDITGPQTFQMPGTAVTVTVTFAKNA